MERCQDKRPRDDKGHLLLSLRRDGKTRDVVLEIGTSYGTFAPSYPADCARSDKILADLLAYLADNQRDDGSFGNPIHNAFAPLAVMASGDKQYRKAIEHCARFHAKTTEAEDSGSLINWRYMAAAIGHRLGAGEQPRSLRMASAGLRTRTLPLLRASDPARPTRPASRSRDRLSIAACTAASFN